MKWLVSGCAFGLSTAFLIFEVVVYLNHAWQYGASQLSEQDMTSKKVKYSKESSWLEISQRFCRFHGLPNGSALKIIYTNSSKFPKGRVQRNNTVYRRAVFRKNTLSRAADNESVRDLINTHLLPYIDIDLHTMGAEVAAFGPDGNRLDSRTHIGTWKELPGLPTDDEIEAASNHETEIDEIAIEARAALNNISEFRWDPEETIPQGVIRALVRQYGATSVRQAMAREL
jgi:hypothetical protein